MTKITTSFTNNFRVKRVCLLTVSKVSVRGHLAPLFWAYEEVEHPGRIPVLSKFRVNREQCGNVSDGHGNKIHPPGTHCLQPTRFIFSISVTLQNRSVDTHVLIKTEPL